MKTPNYKYTVYHGKVPYQPFHALSWKEATSFAKGIIDQGGEVHAVTKYDPDMWVASECD